MRRGANGGLKGLSGGGELVTRVKAGLYHPPLILRDISLAGALIGGRWSEKKRKT